jgi:hypothetical protein
MRQKLKFALVTVAVLALALLMAKWDGGSVLLGVFDGGDG